ncbi:MAG: ribonuclease H [Armatimonadota bacterium]
MKLYIDGASRGNPGSAGIGVVLCNETGEPVKQISEPIGIASNNVAEYRALIRGLEEACAEGWDSVEVYTDSQLLARQLSGQYSVRTPHLVPLYHRALQLLRRFKTAWVYHIPREQNAHADRLAKAAAAQSAKQ